MYRKVLPIRILAVVPLFFLLNSWVDAEIPFTLNEQLKYSATWNFIPVGRASLEVEGMKNIDGKSLYCFVASTKCTLFLISLFYELESKIKSFVQPNSFVPVKYIGYIKKGNRYRRDTILYDQEKHRATWIHFRLGKSLEEHHEKKVMEIPPDVQDPLSTFYYLRTKKLEPGDILSIQVNADKKNWDVKVKVLRRGKMRFQGKSREVLIIEPKAWFQAAFFRRGKMVVWLTDDERKIPLYIQARVPFGIATLSLVTKLDK